MKSRRLANNGGDGHDLRPQAETGAVFHGLSEVFVSKGRSFFGHARLHGCAEEGDVTDPDAFIKTAEK